MVPHGSTWLSRGIEGVTFSDVHHTLVMLPGNRVMHVDSPRARIRPASEFETAIWSRFDFTPEEEEGIAAWAIAHDGAPYNWVSFVLIGLRNLAGLQPSRKVVDWLDRGRSYQCAQFADAALTLGGGRKVFDDGRPFGLVAPADFEVLYKQLGFWPSDFVPAHRLPGIRGMAEYIWPGVFARVRPRLARLVFRTRSA